MPGFDYCSIALDLLSTCPLLNTASSAAATATATAAAGGKKRVETLAFLDPRLAGKRSMYSTVVRVVKLKRAPGRRFLGDSAVRRTERFAASLAISRWVGQTGWQGGRDGVACLWLKQGWSRVPLPGGIRPGQAEQGASGSADAVRVAGVFALPPGVSRGLIDDIRRAKWLVD